MYWKLLQRRKKSFWKGLHDGALIRIYIAWWPSLKNMNVKIQIQIQNYLVDNGIAWEKGVIKIIDSRLNCNDWAKKYDKGSLDQEGLKRVSVKGR